MTSRQRAETGFVDAFDTRTPPEFTPYHRYPANRVRRTLTGGEPGSLVGAF
jgi:hypothetical protein